MHWRSTRIPRRCDAVVALDFETTNIDFATARVISIGAVAFDIDSGEEFDAFNTLVNHGRVRISAGAYAKHGITEHDLADGMCWADAHATLADVTRGALVVSHRMTFDSRMWAGECERYGVGPPERHGLCTKVLTAAAGRRGIRTSLEQACGWIGVDMDGARWHDALFDARKCGELAFALFEHFGSIREAREAHDAMCRDRERLSVSMGLTPTEFSIYQRVVSDD